MEFGPLLSFLKELKKNNNREWFQQNNDRYQLLKKNFIGFVETLLAEVVKFEPEVADLQAKDCMFRINRDIRFSTDKSPYKTNFGTYIVAGGKKSPKAGYYLHIEPGQTFIGGGIWMPPSDILSTLRQEIDYNQDEFKKLMKAASFRKYFDGLEGESLKTAPKGYPADHPMIDILKMKSFVMTHALSDKELKEIDVKNIVAMWKSIKPVNDFFNRTFTTE